jgi:hypothetical protein
MSTSDIKASSYRPVQPLQLSFAPVMLVLPVLPYYEGVVKESRVMKTDCYGNGKIG